MGAIVNIEAQVATTAAQSHGDAPISLDAARVARQVSSGASTHVRAGRSPGRLPVAISATVRFGRLEDCLLAA